LPLSAEGPIANSVPRGLTPERKLERQHEMLPCEAPNDLVHIEGGKYWAI